MTLEVILSFLSCILKSPSEFLRDWQALPKTVRSFFGPQRNWGVYESLEYEINLELLDPDGRYADYHKRHKVRFLQNNVNLYQDIMWGKGN